MQTTPFVGERLLMRWMIDCSHGHCQKAEKDVNKELVRFNKYNSVALLVHRCLQANGCHGLR